MLSLILSVIIQSFLTSLTTLFSLGVCLAAIYYPIPLPHPFVSLTTEMCTQDTKLYMVPNTNMSLVLVCPYRYFLLKWCICHLIYLLCCVFSVKTL